VCTVWSKEELLKLRLESERANQSTFHCPLCDKQMAPAPLAPPKVHQPKELKDDVKTDNKHVTKKKKGYKSSPKKK
jgi:hypothetical protein